MSTFWRGVLSGLTMIGFTVILALLLAWAVSAVF